MTASIPGWLKKLGLVAAGLAFGLGIAELALRLPWERLWGAPAENPGAFRILAIGESTTQGGFRAEDNYPAALGERLRAACPAVQFEVKNAGLAGLTSAEIAENLPGHLRAFRPHLTLSMVGINDELGVARKYGELRRPWRLSRLLRVVFPSLNRDPTPEEVLARIHSGEKIDDDRYVDWVTQPLCNQNRLADAERIHQEVVQHDPVHVMARVGWGTLLRESGRLREAEQLHRQALHFDPENDWVQWELVQDLAAAGRREDAFREAELLAARTKVPDLFFPNLAEFYLKLGERRRAEALFRGLKEPSPRLLWWRAKLFRDAGKVKEAAELEAKSRALTEEGELGPRLRENYHRIAEAAGRAGSILVVLSYPLRSVAPYRRALGEGPRYFSSEEPFRRALRELEYEDLFTDRFGGNFGHLTRDGVAVLADALREYLLAEVPELREKCGAGRSPL